MTFAKDTDVPVNRTRVELDDLLRKHGAMQRIVGEDDELGTAFALFSIAGRQVRLDVPVPLLELILAGEIEPFPAHFRKRTEIQQQEWARKVYDQKRRTRWRALLLLTKAKLEAVELGLSTFEKEFLANVMLPDGRTVYQTIADDVARSYIDGKMPNLLGTGS